MNATTQERETLEELAREIVKSNIGEGEHQPTHALIRGAASGLVTNLSVSVNRLIKHAQLIIEGLLNFPVNEREMSKRLACLDEYRQLTNLDTSAIVFFVSAINRELAKTAQATEGAGEVRS